MGSKYSTNPVSGYSASPPSDDGSTSGSNQVKYSTLKSKLGDPLNTAIAAIDADLVTAFDYSARSITTGDTTIAGDHMRTIEIAPTVSSVVTVSLGDAASMAAGYTVNLANRSNFTCVVGRATASDTINGTGANEVLLALKAVTYKVNSTTNGYVTVSAQSSAPTAPVFDRVVRSAGSVTTTSTSLVDVTGATVTFTTGAFPVAVGATFQSSNNGAGNMFFNIDIDGVLELGTSGVQYTPPATNYYVLAGIAHQSAALTAASHTIKMQWMVTANTGNIDATSANKFSFWAHEIR